MENNTEDKKLIKNFRIVKHVVNGATEGNRTVFPYPIALGATFNPNLIGEIGRAVADEISAKPSENISDLCLITPPFNSGETEEYYASERELAFRCSKAFSRGIERRNKLSNKLNCAAFPLTAISNDADINCVKAWLSQRNSKGIALYSEAKELNVDFARYSGVIYSEYSAPLVLNAGESQSAAVRMRAKKAQKNGITAGGAFYGEGIDALTPSYVKLCAEKINSLSGSLSFNKSKLPAVQKIHTDKNVRTALRAAEESIVLLKNKGNILPFSPSIKKVAVIGDSANSLYSLGCNGESGADTPLNALKRKFFKAINFTYSRCKVTEKGINKTEILEAFAIAGNADVTLLFVSDSDANAFFSSSRKAYADFVKELFGYSKKLAVVYAGIPEDLTLFDMADAIIVCWKSGECGASAVANVINGLSPSGKLPLSIIKNKEETKEYYPFGFGLNYSAAEIFSARKNGKKCEIYVANRHFISIKEVVQIYEKTADGYILAAFKKFSLAGVERKNVIISLPNDISESAELYAAFYMPVDGSGKKIISVTE